MADAMQRAVGLAQFYFKTLAEAAGMSWDGDNATEIELMICEIIDAAHAGVTAEITALDERLAALEQRNGAGTESVRGSTPARKDATCAE